MNIDKKIARRIDSEVNLIISRFLIAVFAVIVAVVLLTYAGVFLTTTTQVWLLLVAASPGAVWSFLVLIRKKLRNDGKTKYFLCFFMCFQAFAVAMVGYSYAGTIILLLPILLSALYPRSKAGAAVAATMICCGFIVPPLALIVGFWDGGYYEFLYDLTYGRQMDTAILSNQCLTVREQILSAIRFCSSQNILIVGGFACIGQLIYRQTNKSFESQREVIWLSETDELTGLLNRNCFERRLEEIASLGTGSLVCFYFDVNGLHELNNKKGHIAGDIMLQFVGKKIQEVFGEENTFRVGGDEYVAFSGNLKPGSLPEVKNSLEEAFASEGYHVAIGYAQSSTRINVNQMVESAEKEMYQAKNEYYMAHDDLKQSMRTRLRNETSVGETV